MNNLQGYKEFEKLMADFAPTFLEPIVQKKLKNQDFYTEQTDFEYIIFNGFSEISNSLKTLNLIEKFIYINPPLDDDINYSNYLTYHVHNYLQEMYILKERLNMYATKIQRKYNKVFDKELLKSIFNPLFEIIKTTLDGITGENGARNKHVHAEKFQDEELKWLSSTTFLANFHDEFKIPSEVAYKSAKNKWHKTICNNNQGLDKLIDIYFNIIYKIISVKDKVVLPETYTKLSNKTLERNSLP